MPTSCLTLQCSLLLSRSFPVCMSNPSALSVRPRERERERESLMILSAHPPHPLLWYYYYCYPRGGILLGENGAVVGEQGPTLI